MIGKEMVKLFGDRLENIPEMSDAVELVRRRPEVANIALEAYRQLVREVASLEGTDWKMIGIINLAYGREFEENPFLAKLGRENIPTLVAFLDSQFGGSNEDINAVNRLCQLMENAHAMKKADISWSPTDGDLKSDEVIWGQTAVTDDQSKVHLAVGHFVSQLIYQRFKPKSGEWGKDDFLSLTDVVAWMAIRYPAHLSNELRGLVFVWYLEKPENLGWISQRRVEVTENTWSEVRDKFSD